jgi:myosin-5
MQSQVWIPDVDQVWVKGDVGSLSGEVDAELEGGETRKVKVEDLYKKINYVYTKGEANLPLRNKDIGEGGVDDMCNLDYLHEPAVLNNLRVRFGVSKPYTYTGPTCIAINPYKWITEIFTPDLRRQFLIKDRDQLMPHAYASSARAFTEMHMQRK